MSSNSKELTKSKSVPRDIGHLGGDEPDVQCEGDETPHPNTDSDIFSFLSAMNNGFTGSGMHPVHVLASRKRKFLDQGTGCQFGSGSGSSKSFGGVKYPIVGRNSEEYPAALHTPQCSQLGFADEEDHQNHLRESEQENVSQENSSKNRPGSSCVNSNLISDIDDTLASDFDGSLSGLGVDIAASTYSMSEALMALPNLSISNGQMFKQEVPSPPTQIKSDRSSCLNNSKNRPSTSPMKEEPLSNPNIFISSKLVKSNKSPLKNFGALDFSNDEAATFPESEESCEGSILGPRTFTGSVSRNGTPTHNFHPLNSSSRHQLLSHSSHGSQGCLAHTSSVVNLSASHPNLTTIGSMNRNDSFCNNSSPAFGLDQGQTSPSKSHKVILPLHNSRKDSQEQMALTSSSSSVASESGNNGAFQYILNACTSIATKVNEPSITYLNQGQAYELTLKKMTEFPLMTSQRKRLIKCQIRICFHERRLQYMELEQISEWSLKHPTERILDLDLPLSYGIIDPVRDPCNLNVVTFKWDPSRDTGVYIKVNCISTEFTPKKHGGEKGVPFRLQVESFDLDDNRLHAAGCILQVFKLKGADRKHKQDRDKIQKRPSSEQDKFARAFECTFLTPIPPESLYNPSNSRSASPENGSDGSVSHGRNSREENIAQGMFYLGSGAHQFDKEFSSAPACLNPMSAAAVSGGSGNLVGMINPNYPSNMLSAFATVEQVIQWLSRNRYGTLLPNFRNYNGRDLLRLSREDVIAMCGMSDGIRLYNDLHLVSISPRSTFYVAMKDTNEYDALFLEELTVAELIKRLAICIGLQDNTFGCVYKRTQADCLVRVTDAVVRYINPESVFYFTLRHTDDGKCDVILEDASSLDPLNTTNMTGSVNNKGMVNMGAMENSNTNL